jgi:DNA-binding PadR family transcriptional regulator
MAPHPRIDAPAIKEGIQYLRDHGMIEPYSLEEHIYTTTEKGRFYLEWILHVPFPRGVWEMPPAVSKHLSQCHGMTTTTRFNEGENNAG